LLTVRDAKNPFWNVYGALQSSKNLGPYTSYTYELYSDVIQEGVNVASSGNFTLSITFTDGNTGLSASSLSLYVEIMQVGDYEHFLLSYVAPVKEQTSKGPPAQGKGSFAGFTSSPNQNEKKCDESTKKAANTSSFLKEPSKAKIEELYMASYGTVENYLRSYGGAVSVAQVSLSKDFELTVTFSRALAYPRDLLVEYDPTFKEVVPKLTPTANDQEQIDKEYD